MAPELLIFPQGKVPNDPGGKMNADTDNSTVPILLVEDEQDYTVLIRDAIQDADFRCELRVVESGEEAIAYLSGEGKYADREKFPYPFLVLLDLRMPGMGGFGVLRWISGQPEVKQKVQIVILSSVQSPKDIEVVYELGAQFFWPKSECALLQDKIRRLRDSWTHLN